MTEEKGLFYTPANDQANQQDLSIEKIGSTSDQLLEFPETGNYLAFNISRTNRRETRLDIRRRNGTGTIIYYGYIAVIEYSGNETITLVYQNSVFTINGKNLRKLREALQDERVRYIQEAMINTKVESDQPIIESITQTLLGAEE